jgi:hypothetical protein
MLHGDGVQKQLDGSESVVGQITVMANLSANPDPLISGRVGLLLTESDGRTKLDKVVGGGLIYKKLKASEVIR